MRVPFPNRDIVERAIDRSNMTGMSLNDGNERVILPIGTLQIMLRMIDAIGADLNAKHANNDLADGVSGCKTEFKDGEIVQTILSRDDIYLEPEPKEK